MEKTYLVTGCAGFIGFNLTESLLAQGHGVVGIDNLNDAYDQRLKRWRLEQLEGLPGFDFCRLDIADLGALKRLAAERDLSSLAAVINLAARAGVRQSVADPWAYIETNVTGTLNLLEVCRVAGLKKFVLASSSSLYGKDTPSPFREDARTDQPLSPYAASKQAAENLCYTYHHLYGIDVTAFRFFTVYGPAGRPDMSIFRFVQRIFEGRPITIYGDGSQTRDFTYVGDIAKGIVAGLGDVGYEVINLGSDRPLPLVDVIRQIEDMAGKKAVLEFDDQHPADMAATWADATKARQVLGWTASTRFEEGIRLAGDWYRANRDWAKSIEIG